MPLFAGNLKLELAEANRKIISIEKELKTVKEENVQLKQERDNYKNLIVDDNGQRRNIKNEINNLNEERKRIKLEIEKNEKKNNELIEEIEINRAKYIETNESVLLQSFDLYEPQYNFAKSDLYKEKLKEIRNKQKELIKESKVAICSKQWSIEGNLNKGQKFVEANIKQIIKTFNIECENIISKVKFSNFDVCKKRIKKIYDDLNKLNDINKISIQEEYLNLKLDELTLGYEYARKREEEKEELRRQRELHREEMKLAEELAEKRAEIEKEQEHYNNALKKINEQIMLEKEEEKHKWLIEKKEQIENNLIDLNETLKDIDYREANQKAGYVYIISNIGAFGENVYKIGMTRRLEPQDRIDELGGASVPFKFDVHALIFSEDAPKLEATLHKAFENKKVNMVNRRKEFFKVTLEEIEDVVKTNYDKTVDFNYMAEAEQYRESLLIKGENN